MKNAFVASLEARIVLAKEKNASEANINKLNKMRDAFTSQALTALFESANVDADAMMRAIYASEKVIRFAAQAVDHKHSLNNEMMYVAFRTAINCFRNDELLLKQDIIDACSASAIVSDERKHLVFQRKHHKADSTTKAQHQTSIDALKTLNIISESADRRNAFNVNMNALAIALAKKLKIDIEKIEKEESETENETDENIAA